MDKGLVSIIVSGYDDPSWNNHNLRCSTSSIGGNTYLVLDCQCHQDKPVDYNEMVEIVSDWVDNNTLPMQ
ncbi:MAG: hypothetical protein EB127_07640 [Alphaproteobacteria bacterium]|nr:hypothetical protein [Alphaproteobacteria bacterium]